MPVTGEDATDVAAMRAGERSPGSRRDRFMTWLSRRTLHQQLGALAAVGLLVSAPFGGLDRASGTGSTSGSSNSSGSSSSSVGAVPVVAPGQPVDATPFRIVVTKAVATPEAGGSLPRLTGEQTYLLIGVTISTTDTRTAYLAADAVRLRGVGSLLDTTTVTRAAIAPDDQVAPRLYQVKDDSALDGVQPGLTYDAAFVVTRATTADLPSHVTVVLYRHTYRPHTALGTYDWFDPVPVAQVTVPVTRPTAAVTP